MAKNEYTFGQNRNSAVSRGPGGPGGPGRGPGGMGATEHAADFKGAWGKLLRYCKKYLPTMAAAAVCALAGAVLTLVGPDKLSQITDLITGGLMSGIDLDAVAAIGFTLILFYAISAAASLLQGGIMATVTQRICRMLRTDISKKINRLPMWFFNRTKTGDVLSRVTNDVDTVGQSLNQSVGTLVSAVALLFGSLFMMLKTNLLMTLTAVAASLVGFALMIVIMSRSQKYFSKQQTALGLINGHVEEIFAGHTVVKAYSGENDARKAFEAYNGELRDSMFRAQFLSGLMMPLMSFIGNFGYVAVCVVGAVLAMNGSISFGVIVAFMLYVRYFTQPFSQLAQAAQSLQSAAAAGERVFEFLDAGEMEDESAKSQSPVVSKGEVAFEHVKFGYEDSDSIVIRDFSAEAKPGQKIAIVGPTGAGKTTMVNLLMRFHEIQGGSIRIDDVSTKDMSRK